MRYKVLHIVPSLSYVSGISSVIMNYYYLIDKDKYQFDFMYIKESDTDYRKEIEKLGGKTFYIDNILNIFDFKKRIKKFCKEHKNEYSIIHLHMPFLYVFFYQLKKKLNAKVFILHAHSTKFGDTTIKNIRNKIAFHVFFKKADSFFACSKEAGFSIFKNNYIRNGYLMQNFVNINFLDYKIPKDIAKKKLSLQNDFVIGHVGIFHEPKNHKFIIDVFSEILQKKPNSKLLLVGDGALRPMIEEYAKTKGVYDHVVFSGSRVDVYNFYSAMDVFLFPSLFEGFAMALLEAQMFNIPCIASDVIIKEVNINKKSNMFLSLNCSSKTWAENVIKIYHKNIHEDNIDIYKKIAKKNVNSLEKKYFELINGDEK